jgi:hypothetical protein
MKTFEQVEELRNGFWIAKGIEINRESFIIREAVYKLKPWVRYRDLFYNNFLYLRNSFNQNIYEFRFWRIQVGIKFL